MTSSRGDSDGVLATLARRLASGADSFTPARDRDDHHSLPGRRRGAGLESARAASAHPVTGPAAAVLDCGTSRRDGFTHVLWISPSVESILGSHAVDRLAGVVGGLDSVTRVAWEGADRLHVAAGDVAHEDLLDAAREAVAAIPR